MNIISPRIRLLFLPFYSTLKLEQDCFLGLKMEFFLCCDGFLFLYLKSYYIMAYCRLDYPGVGPEHSFLKDLGRAEYYSITDEEALEGTYFILGELQVSTLWFVKSYGSGPLRCICILPFCSWVV